MDDLLYVYEDIPITDRSISGISNTREYNRRLSKWTSMFLARRKAIENNDWTTTDNIENMHELLLFHLPGIVNEI